MRLPAVVSLRWRAALFFVGEAVLPWIDFVPVALAAFAAYVDLRRREIPDSIWILVVALIPLRVWWLRPEIALWQLPVGAVTALLIGCLVARGDRFGGGDVKLFAALGAWYGVIAVLPLALWCAIAGLPLAIIAATRGQKDFAFGPAIATGALIHWWMPDLLGKIAGLA